MQNQQSKPMPYLRTGEEIEMKMRRDFERYTELEERGRTIGLLPSERREFIKLVRMVRPRRARGVR